MKKLLTILTFTVALCGCNAKTNKNTPAIKEENPEIKKIDLVLSQMSPRFQEEISIQNKDEFLQELKVVLEDEKKYRTDDLDLYYLIDKKHNVGSEYVPKDLVKLVKNPDFNISRNDLSLRPEAYQALMELSQGALNDGLRLLVSSTYRSYDYQKALFERWVRIDGLEEAERESARAGTSQHQLGTAIDFGNIDDSFINTKEGQWLEQNAYKYGWSLSFPKNYEDITGYRWECWHYRFIGKNACAFQKKWFNNVQQYMLEFIDLWKNS